MSYSEVARERTQFQMTHQQISAMTRHLRANNVAQGALPSDNHLGSYNTFILYYALLLVTGYRIFVAVYACKYTALSTSVS